VDAFCNMSEQRLITRFRLSVSLIHSQYFLTIIFSEDVQNMKNERARDFAGRFFVPNPSQVDPNSKRNVTYKLARFQKVRQMLNEPAMDLNAFQDRLEKLILHWNADIFGLDDPALIECNYRSAKQLVSTGVRRTKASSVDRRPRHRRSFSDGAISEKTKEKLEELRDRTDALQRHGDALEESLDIADRAVAEIKKKRKREEHQPEQKKMSIDDSDDFYSGGSEGDDDDAKEPSKPLLATDLGEEEEIDRIHLSEVPARVDRKRKGSAYAPNKWAVKPDPGTF